MTKMLIEIPDEIIGYIRNEYEFKNVQDEAFIISAIANGTILKEETKMVEPQESEDTSESNSNEMIAAHILESINEGFNKERLLHSWFGDNCRRDIAFKRAILALRAIDNIGNNMEEYYFSCLDLPSVTPQEPKTGHWIAVHPLQPNDEGDYMCSVCRCGGLTYKPTKFCPNCGVKMVEPQESEADNGNDNNN